MRKRLAEAEETKSDGKDRTKSYDDMLSIARAIIMMLQRTKSREMLAQ